MLKVVKLSEHSDSFCICTDLCVYFCIPFTQSVLQNEGCLPALLAGQHLRVLLYCVRLSGLLVSLVPHHEAGRSLSFGWRCSDLQLHWEARPWRSPGRVLAGSSWQLGSRRDGSGCFSAAVCSPCRSTQSRAPARLSGVHGFIAKLRVGLRCFFQKTKKSPKDLSTSGFYQKSQLRLDVG